MFTHVTACTLAGPPEVIRYIEGFSYFVTSITAPIASGWSEIAGWDSHPLEKRRLNTAHAVSSLLQCSIVLSSVMPPGSRHRMTASDPKGTFVSI